MDIETIQKLYLKYNSLSLVAKELGCGKSTISYHLKKNNLPINKPILYSFNKEFFKLESELSFYWAGFIAADGCIKIKNNSKILNIGLSSKDKSHILNFKNNINSNHPIHDKTIKNSKNNKNWNDTFASEINICSNELCDDLLKFNITPRKTKTYKFPENIINHKYLNHFMRGYFDGDGSWYLNKQKNIHQLFFNLRGTIDFLFIFRKILEEKCFLKHREKDIRINCNIGSLEYGGNKICNNIYNFIYNNSAVFLGRKFELSTNHLNNYLADHKLNI